LNLYLITYPAPVENECLILNQLFENGLEYLHLRKPDYTIAETEMLLNEINPEFYSRISLHQHHELHKKFSISRFHYTEGKRKQMADSLLNGNKTDSITLSTSVHSSEDYNKLSTVFDYCFFGPVFNSISKKNYNSVVNNNFKANEKTTTALIAIGGIDENNISEIKKMGFSGIALLGAIWLSENPVEKFLQIKKLCQKNQYAC